MTQQFFLTEFVRVPKTCEEISIISPSFKKRVGFCEAPVPSGEPVAIISPGFSGNIAETYSII